MLAERSCVRDAGSDRLPLHGTNINLRQKCNDVIR